MRTELKTGVTINLSSASSTRALVIDSVIGKGASCIAYDVHEAPCEIANTSKKYRLKECYPAEASIDRNGIILYWNDNQERRTAFDQFTKAVQILSDLRNERSVGNNITGAELYEANGTLYALMDINYATVYAFDESSDLNDILETALVLTRIVGHLHKLGFLHLDIKPENFQVSYDPTINIWLFDVDSLTSISDLSSGKIVHIPYSQTWAAPEQISGKLSLIGPQTDFYAIGAILFSKLMGRRVCADDCGRYSEWEYPDSMFASINPALKRIVTEIFHHTLATIPKRRYSSADQLATALEEACLIASNNLPYLISDYPMPASWFVGRQGEMERIEQSLATGSKVVFVHGVGGIGKSELVKAYASVHVTDYDAIVFLRYRDSLHNLLSSIPIQNFVGSDADHFSMLRQVLGSHVLLIIDNYDVAIDDLDELELILSYKADVLITTRTDFSEILPKGSTIVEVPCLDNSNLKRLFCLHAKIDRLSIEEDRELSSLLILIGQHTMMTELLGRQAQYSALSIHDIITRLRIGIYGFDATEKIQAVKDGQVQKNKIPAYLKILFDLSELSEKQYQVLRNMCLLSFVRITRRNYKEWLSADSDEMDALNELIERGWINSIKMQSQQSYDLHPLIVQLIKNELHPDSNNCKTLFSYIDDVSEDIDWDAPKGFYGWPRFENSDEERYPESAKFFNQFRFVCGFFLNADLSELGTWKALYNWLIKSAYDDVNASRPYFNTAEDIEELYRYPYDPMMQKLVLQMKEVYPKTIATSLFDCIDNALLMLGVTEEEKYFIDAFHALQSMRKKQECGDNTWIRIYMHYQERLAIHVSWIISKGRSTFSADSIRLAYDLAPWHFSTETCERYSLPIPEEEQEKSQDEISPHKETLWQKSEEDEIYDDLYTVFVESIKTIRPLTPIIQDFIGNDDISITNRVNLLAEIFQLKPGEGWFSIDKYQNWSLLQEWKDWDEALTIIQNFLTKYEAQAKEIEDICEEWHDQQVNYRFLATRAALVLDKESFCAKAQKDYDSIFNYIVKVLPRDSRGFYYDWLFMYPLREFFFIRSCANTFHLNHRIVPFEIELTVKLAKLFRGTEYEHRLFSFYREVADIIEKSLNEVSPSNVCYSEWSRYLIEFRREMELLADIRYDLKQYNNEE